MGVYLEHTAGHLPFWLSPVQVKILNVTDRQNEFCLELLKKCKEHGLRAEFDDRSEKLGYKIREAQLEKTPYMLTIGDKEVEANTVSVRLRNGDTKYGVDISEFLKKASEENQMRKLHSPWLEQ